MRVLMLGDGCVLSTGFGQVNNRIAKEMVARGWDVAQITALDTAPICDSEPYKAMGVRPYFPSGSDILGIRHVGEVVERETPDCIVIVADPGTAAGWMAMLDRNRNTDIATVLYAPIEGAPILPTYARPFRAATRGFTATAWGARALHAEHGITAPGLHHGVDTTVFRPLDPDVRAAVRRNLGWDDRFVIAYVARNIERKAHDRLLKALAYLHQQGGMTDVLAYLHCKPNDLLPPRGFDLAGIAHWCGVSAHVQFAGFEDTTRGIPAVDLATKLAAADLYVSPSKVEGFGLPLLEAAACGLPIIIPQDGGNQEEVTGDIAVKVPVHDWDTWFNGAQLACVDPRHLAFAIREVRKNAELMARMRADGPPHAATFSWGHMARTIADAVVDAVHTQRGVPRTERGIIDDIGVDAPDVNADAATAMVNVAG